MDNNQSEYNNSIINNDITTNSIANEGININSNESTKQVPKSFYNSLLNHYYFNKKMMQEMKNTFSQKYLDMKDECEKLKKELKKYNMIKTTEEQNDNNISVSSIFKKKDKTESEKNIMLQLEINKSDNKILSQQGGNKSDKNIKSHKSEEKKKHVKIKSESEKSDDESDEETETSESESNSTSYEDTSDIYHATETEDGMSKAYNKLSREMDHISKLQRSGKMKGKEVVKRINFLLNGLQILDSVKKVIRDENKNKYFSLLFR